MIEHLRGRIAELSPAQAVVECCGVGYGVNISLNTYTALQGKAECKLFVSEMIREDAHVLYGFATREERELFLLLVTVPGIGGNTARMILSSLSPNELVAVITAGNEAALLASQSGQCRRRSGRRGRHGPHHARLCRTAVAQGRVVDCRRVAGTAGRGYYQTGAQTPLNPTGLPADASSLNLHIGFAHRHHGLYMDRGRGGTCPHAGTGCGGDGRGRLGQAALLGAQDLPRDIPRPAARGGGPQEPRGARDRGRI